MNNEATLPIISRRSIKDLFFELGPRLPRSKAADLRARLDSNDPDQSIPAEYELVIGWGASRLGHIEIGKLYGTRDPDFTVRDLFPGVEAVIEVAAMSDDALSGESSMERTANIINDFANSVRKRSSQHLYYQFGEISGYRPVPLPRPIGPWTRESQFFRRRLTSKAFQLTAEIKTQIKLWLQIWPPAGPLLIAAPETQVQISYREKVHPAARTFSSMPSEIHDVNDNPLLTLLENKADQLAAVPAHMLKCIVLGDAGCRLLSHPNERDPLRRRVSGSDVISHFLKRSKVDIVVIMSPRRKHEHAWHHHNNPRLWTMTILEKMPHPSDFYDKLFSICQLLPKPHLHGYQARSWVKQGMLRPQARGQYLPMSWGRSKVKLSARALLELLAGRMSAEDFRNWISGENNPFEVQLQHGNAISGVGFEATGIENDDDYVVIEFSTDANASKLGMPPKLLDE